MGIRKIKVMEDLPFEVGKTYMTKMQTKEMFTITKINVDVKTGKQKDQIEGIYPTRPDLGTCPFRLERLISDKKEVGEKEVCDCCSQPLEEKYKGKRFQNL
jgi:hypothetical protein